MTRMLYSLGSCAIVATLCVIELCVQQWRQDDRVLDELHNRPCVVEVFRQQEDQRAEAAQTMTSPLLTQAEALANYLDPPAPVVAESTAPPSESKTDEIDLPSLVSESVTPQAVSADFRVIAVSYYPQQPERSMALMEPAVGGEAKWVKEDEQIGHFVVHEISPGRVILRHGEQRCELMVSGRRTERTLVRAVRPGSPQANAAGSNSASATEARNEVDW